MFKRLGLWCISLVVLTGATRAGWADDWAIVSVNHCDEISAGEPARAFRKELAKQTTARVYTEDETARALGGRVGGSMDEAERLIESARLDFIASSTDRAEKEITDATELVAALPPSPKRWVDYKEARTLAAWFFLHRGAREAAEASLREILEVEPDYRPDSAAYPPKVVALSQLLRAALRKTKVQELEVQTEPPGLPVYVGLRAAGTSPVKMKLPIGVYRVEAAFPKVRGLPIRIELADERAVALLKTSFHGAISPSRGPCVTAPSGRAESLGLLTRLATTLNAQKLVALELDEPVPGEQYLAASLLDSVKGEEIRAARVKVASGTSPVGATHDLAAFIATGRAVQNMQIVTSPLPGAMAAVPPAAPKADVPAALVVSQPAPVASGRPPRWTSYAAGGVGAAALAFGGLEIAMQRSAVAKAESVYGKAHSGDAAAQAQFRSEQVNASRSATLATVGVAAGGVGLLAGAILYFISNSPSTPAVSVDFHNGFRGVVVAQRF
jgi:hypothetical protein